MTELRTFYPEIEPYETGLLDVGDGHRIYWERVGTRGKKPAVFLHGGPGGGLSPSQRRAFDPDKYDVAAAARCPSPALSTTPPGTSSPTSKSCGR